ncbi:hypothetical protein ASF84_16300 [Pseudomonas sp. Leaf127]|uniref:hypothetical protein n=1 Tax=Pseudomonas TaxID=286 RepID=UPI0007025311|nr:MULTISPECIES: hypothetical protein [Pseudomonas]KQQ54874.1 hypothetical protein ASF84_16300 [Pseudomonas sp. Leaf127]
MPRLVSNLMEFETTMDPALGQAINSMLALIDEQSEHCKGCEMRPSGHANGWIIECSWRDTRSMHAHFASPSLQVLINLLISRSTRIAFGLGASRGAKDASVSAAHSSSQKVT